MRSKTRRITIPVMLAFALLMFLPPSSAVAIPGCEGEPAPIPESGWSGPSGMAGLANVYSYPSSDEDLPQAEGEEEKKEESVALLEEMPRADAYGEYGVAGLQWHLITESCVDQATKAPLSAAASAVWLVARSIGALALSVYDAAMMGRFRNQLNGVVIDLVEAGRTGIWRPLLTPILILGSMWMAWKGLGQKRATLSIQGSLWMLGVVAMALIFLHQPFEVLRTADRIAMGGRDLSSAVLATVNPPSDETKGCPDEWEGSELVRPGADHNRDTIRVTADSLDHMWIGFLCEPWMAGMVGSGPGGAALRSTDGWEMLHSQGTARSTESDATDLLVDDELTEAQQNLYSEVAESVETRDAPIYATFSGRKPVERLGIATFALLAIAISGALLVGLGVAAIFYQIMWVVLVALSPVTLLIGVHPGMGRTVMHRWLEYTLGALLKQVLYLLMMQIVGYLYRTIMALDLPWALQMVLVALLAAVLLWYRKTWSGAATGIAQAAAPQVANVAVSVAPGQDGRSGRDGSSGASGASGRDGSSGHTTVRTRGAGDKRRPSRPGASQGSGGEDSGSSGSGSGSSTQGPSGRGSSGRGGAGERRGAAGASGGGGGRREDPGGSGRRGSGAEAPPLRRPGQGRPEERESGPGREGASDGVPETPSNTDVPRPSRTRGSTAGDVRGVGTDRTGGRGRR